MKPRRHFRSVYHPLGERIVVTVVGDLDLVSAAQFGRTVDDAASVGRPMHLDLRRVDFCDSSCIHAISRVLDLARRRSLTVTIAASHPVRRSAELAGVAHLLAGYTPTV